MERAVIGNVSVSDDLIQTKKGTGYSKQSWLDEADRHLMSAKFLRRIKRRRRNSFRNSSDDSNRLNHILVMSATTHSSMLLIGYAVELFLKAGLTHVYIGCPMNLFKREVKQKYSHKLFELAKDIEYPSLSQNSERLKGLEKIVRSEGRYPNLAYNLTEATKLEQERALLFWDDDQFQDFYNLATSIREYVIRIDQNADNPMFGVQTPIDQDGYFAFRCGGHLIPQVTVKYSSVQKDNCRNNKEDLKRLIVGKVSNPLIAKYWGAAQFRCVKE